jgi:hypothetical protein
MAGEHKNRGFRRAVPGDKDLIGVLQKAPASAEAFWSKAGSAHERNRSSTALTPTPGGTGQREAGVPLRASLPPDGADTSLINWWALVGPEDGWLRILETRR